MPIYFCCNKCNGTFDPAFTYCPVCDGEQHDEIARLQSELAESRRQYEWAFNGWENLKGHCDFLNDELKAARAGIKARNDSAFEAHELIKQLRAEIERMSISIARLRSVTSSRSYPAANKPMRVRTASLKD